MADEEADALRTPAAPVIPAVDPMANLGGELQAEAAAQAEDAAQAARRARLGEQEGEANRGTVRDAGGAAAAAPGAARVPVANIYTYERWWRRSSYGARA